MKSPVEGFARVASAVGLTLFLYACSGGTAAEPSADQIREALHGNADFMTWRLDSLSDQKVPPKDAEDMYAHLKVELNNCKLHTGDGYACDFRSGWVAQDFVSWSAWWQVIAVQRNGTWQITPQDPNKKLWVDYLDAKAKGALHPDFPPVVADLAPGYGFADGKPRDVLGVALGATESEASAAMAAAYPDLKPRSGIESLSASDKGGNKVTVGYHASDEIAGTSGDTSVYFHVTYTTAVSGARVAGIERTEKYAGAQPDAKGFMEALTAKYGPPSVRREDNGAVAQLEWMWINGELAPLSPLPPEACERNAYAGQYAFVRNRRDDGKECTAFLTVEVWYGKSQDMAREVKMTLWDLKRGLDNAVATDQWLMTEVDKARASAKPAAAPAV